MSERSARCCCYREGQVNAINPKHEHLVQPQAADVITGQTRGNRT
jgi:hypothetical protein